MSTSAKAGADIGAGAEAVKHRGRSALAAPISVGGTRPPVRHRCGASARRAAPTPRRAGESRSRTAASHLPWAGLTLTPKLPGSHGFRWGDAVSLTMRPVEVDYVCSRPWCLCDVRAGVREDRRWG